MSDEQEPFDKPQRGDAWGEAISPERQAALEQRLQAWEREADHGERKGPLDGVALTGADVFWLAVRTVARAHGAQGVAEPMQRLRSVTASDWAAQLSVYLAAFHLEGAILSDAHLEGAALVGAHLEGARLTQAHLERAVLTWAHLEGADLTAAHLEGIFLFGAYLQGARLAHAHLEGAALAGARLEGADLTAAHLEGADLTAARLDGAVLEGANLEGAAILLCLTPFGRDPAFQEHSLKRWIERAFVDAQDVF